MARAMPRRPIHSSHALAESDFARPLLEQPASHRRPRLSRDADTSLSESRLPAVSVWDVLEEVLATLGPTAAGVGIQVALLTPAAPGVPHVAADSTRFAQILMRLGSNAIKYNRAGGSVTFAVRRVDPDVVRVSVVDTGTSLPRGKHDNLFHVVQPAGREQSLQRPRLGLASSKRLVKMMNGAIGCRSFWPRGAEFWLDLPVYL
jgi:signal transduction histidine kinase